MLPIGSGDVLSLDTLFENYISADASRKGIHSSALSPELLVGHPNANWCPQLHMILSKSKPGTPAPVKKNLLFLYSPSTLSPKLDTWALSLLLPMSCSSGPASSTYSVSLIHLRFPPLWFSSPGSVQYLFLWTRFLLSLHLICWSQSSVSKAWF